MKRVPEKREPTVQRQSITVTVIPSTEEIDLDAWLSRYVAAILEAEGYPATPQTEAA
jgi:hypothetical protein